MLNNGAMDSIHRRLHARQQKWIRLDASLTDENGPSLIARQRAACNKNSRRDGMQSKSVSHRTASQRIGRPHDPFLERRKQHPFSPFPRQKNRASMACGCI